MRDARLATGVVAMALACAAPFAVGDDTPDPALLEFLGTTARLESAGIDVERLVDSRLANADRRKKAHARVDDESEESDG